MIRFSIGLVLCLATWSVVLRRGAKARPLWTTPPIAAVLDAAPIVLGFAALLGATARPLLAGLVITALAAGLSLADRVKRVVLDEPVVFADRAELAEVVRHPSLYLPFAGSAWVLAGAGVGVLALAILLAWAEPALWTRSLASALIEAVVAAGVSFGCFMIPANWPTLLTRLATFYSTHLVVSRDPALDATAFGPLACLAIHATIAAAERPGLRVAAPKAAIPLAAIPSEIRPIILVQAESFFDPSRLHPDLAGMLPHFESLARVAALSGRLQVPAWGANTVRTEFAVLTGLPEAALGLDRFNPYEAFAQAKGTALPSLVQTAKASGYRTVFVHPFDLGFYHRNRVMPRLGFDEMVGPEAFATARRRGDWVSDEALGDVVATVLRRHGPRVFIFAATMEAHGPWGTPKPGELVDLPPAVRDLPEAGQVAQWLWHLQGTDRMVRRLADDLAGYGPGRGWLAVYGDHQPSLPATFAAAGLADRRSDYLIWTPPGLPSLHTVRDLAAESIGSALTRLMAETEL